MGRRIRVFFGTFVFLIGSICFLYPNFREWKTQRDVDQIIENYQEKNDRERDEQKSDTIPDKGSEQINETETVGLTELYAEMQGYNQRLMAEGQQIVDAWSYEQAPIDLASLGNENSAIGYIEIPDMKVRMPLFLGASNENLSQGAAVLSETSLPIGGENTNCVIAGHRGYRGSAYFQYIENMKKGSFVYVTNPWEMLVYRVTEIKIICPDDVSSILIQAGKDMVTLFSCHPYGGGGLYRYVVFCERDGTAAGAASDPVGDPETTLSCPAEAGTEGISYDLVAWEGYMRIALPPLTLLLAGMVVAFRHIRNKKDKREEDLY